GRPASPRPDGSGQPVAGSPSAVGRRPLGGLRVSPRGAGSRTPRTLTWPGRPPWSPLSSSGNVRGLMRTVFKLMLYASIAAAPACGDDDRAALSQRDTAPTLGLDATGSSDTTGADGDTALPATCVRDDDCAS